MSPTAAQLLDPPWNPCYRLVPSRFPPVAIFEAVSTAEDFETLFAVQALVNPRLRQEIGEIDLVPKGDRVFGPGSSPVMAAFCHLNPEGSRFSDGTWGVYYGAVGLDTAVAEVSYHRANFLAATKQPAMDIDLRCYVAAVDAQMHDVRHMEELHHPDDYGASRAAARSMRESGVAALLYRSVRNAGGECVAAFKPTAIKVPVTQGPHVSLCWDGSRIRAWYIKSEVHAL